MIASFVASGPVGGEGAVLDENVAARWFRVRAEYERWGKIRAAWATVRGFLFMLATIGVFGLELDPARVFTTDYLRQVLGS